ncbi:hypothetical protein B0H11DRAFT_2365582 [Mycena galericulata]|nr:hypothetical protein B0H11DRAFT_2365582 [Mycena galericulata]
MSSRASTPPRDEDDDDLHDMLNAMTQSSPVVPDAGGASKRNHAAMVGDDETTSDNEQRAGNAPPFALANRNIVSAARHYGERKRLEGEQLTELDIFLGDPPSLREAKLLANIFAVGNQVKKLVTTRPAYEVSSDLVTNIHKYAPAVLLSSKINVYKGDGTTNVLLAILKNNRFDIPPGLENVPADWAKVTAVVQDALTQKRAKIKKAIRSSLKPKKDGGYAPDAEHLNIYELTVIVVKGTQCTVNVVLCSRVALMRSVYLKHPGNKFWDKLDERLARIRQEADGDANKIIKAFRHVLTKDQEKHGVKNYELDEKTVDEFQLKVDELIDVEAADAASSAQADADVE